MVKNLKGCGSCVYSVLQLSLSRRRADKVCNKETSNLYQKTVGDNIWCGCYKPLEWKQEAKAEQCTSAE